MPAIWGKATATLRRSPQFSWVDAIVLLTLAAVIFGIGRTAQQWTGALRPAVEIDLSIRALPKYTLLSLSRGLVAYVLSLLFSLAYGYWAAKDRIAERVLIPILDVLQSIPVLGFLPGVVLALVAAFPRSNIGLELAAILLIFTGQAWNMTFSFYHSVRSIPNDQQEVATIYRFTAWERFRWVELPFSTIGLVWNSMMSMAGGWFFLMISEAFVLGDNDFRLPGLGSYMSVAVARGNDRHDRPAGSASLAAGSGLGREVPGRGGWGRSCPKLVVSQLVAPLATNRIAGRAAEATQQPRSFAATARDSIRARPLAEAREDRFDTVAAGTAPWQPTRRLPAVRAVAPGEHRPMEADGFLRTVHPGARPARHRVGHRVDRSGRTCNRIVTAAFPAVAAGHPAARLLSRADALSRGHRDPGCRRGLTRLGQCRADASGHPMVRAVQRHCRSDGGAGRLARGCDQLPLSEIRKVVEAVLARDLSLFDNRLDHRRWRRVECEHRL